MSKQDSTPPATEVATTVPTLWEKRLPVLFIKFHQSARFTPKLTTVQIVPLTSRVKARRFPATLVIDPDPLNHLSARSVALVFQLRAIDRRRLQAKLGALNADQLTRIKGLVRELLDL